MNPRVVLTGAAFLLALPVSLNQFSQWRARSAERDLASSLAARAEQALEAGRVEEAADLAARAESVVAASPRARRAHADAVRRLLLERPRTLSPEAARRATVVLRSAHTDAPTLAALGNAYLVLNRRADASAAYDAALEADPDDPDALLYRGLMVDERQTREEGLARLKTAVEKHPKHHRARLRYAEQLLLDGRYEDALAEAKAAAELRADPETLKVLGSALVSSGDAQTGVAVWSRALKGAPQDAEIQLGHLEALVLTGRFRDAVDQIATLNPPSLRESARVMRLHGLSLRGVGRSQEALGVFARLAQREGETAENMWTVAQLAFEMGDRELARRAVEKYLELAQGRPEMAQQVEEAKNALAALQRPPPDINKLPPPQKEAPE